MNLTKSNQIAAKRVRTLQKDACFKPAIMTAYKIDEIE